MDDDGILPHLNAAKIRAAYLAAPGNEIETGKFASPQSSSALAANVFGLYLDQPGILPVLSGTEDLGWPAAKVELECTLRFPWSGGRHPCLDVLVETSAGLIGIECKRYEPFRSKKDPTLSEAYWRPVWGENMRGFETCRDSLRDGSLHFEHLDAAQLVKHAFGLRTSVQQGAPWPERNPVLYYVFKEPDSWPGGGKSIPESVKDKHRQEIAAFAKMVAGDEVGFERISYSELVISWASDSNVSVKHHAGALREHFQL